MPSNFVVIHGDDPKEITPDGSAEFRFGFPPKEQPALREPAMLILNVQNLIERCEVKLNGSSIGHLSPVTGFTVAGKLDLTTKLTSPTYNQRTWQQMYNYPYNPTIQQFLETVEMEFNLDDPELSEQNLFYWSTQMIHLNMGDKLNRYSESSTEGIYEADYEGGVNRLRIDSVSQAFKVKDIVLNYPIRSSAED